MSLAEKLHLVILFNTRTVQNINEGIRSLCIPALTLQDGPGGLASRASGVTQLPAPLALAATFDVGLARTYGQVEGAEARTKGVDVLQSPELNLLRVPTSGRGFEAFGEDPLLTGELGAAVVAGIQSQGVMSQLKHFPLYNQETARQDLNQKVSERALEEIYFRPFQIAVSAGHAASVMCEYGSVNGTNACQDPSFFQELASWGFKGFVRSDLASVSNSVAAFKAGLSLIKPASFKHLRQAVISGRLPVSDIDRAIEAVLTEMFRYGLVTHPRKLTMATMATSPTHAAVALQVAERSIVLLKNQGDLLPLRTRGMPRAKGPGSIALIGTGAGEGAMTSGYGTSYVKASSIVTPIGAIRAQVASGTVLRVADAAPSATLAAIPRSAVLEGSPAPAGPPAAVDVGENDSPDFVATGVPRSDLTATVPSTSAPWARWAATISPPATGLYDIWIVSNGDTFFTVDGRVILASRGLHARSPWSVAVQLRAGKHYRFAMSWFDGPNHPAPAVSWQYVTPLIERARTAARSASVAIVFAQDWNSEGSDRPNLNLPGYQNALIAAVSAVNHHTIVVLDTGGPVLMPWLSHVAAVLEAWYPGQADGTAIANVLFGRIDPTGHLPVTFPMSSVQGPAFASPASYPGIDGTVTYSEGLDIGYRYFQTHHQHPLFPFGFGLSYTTFAFSGLHVTRSARKGGGGVTVHVTVTDTGRYAGTAVAQAYVGFPPVAGEPPLQLAGFTPVPLRPGVSRRVTIQLPSRSFEAFLHGHFTMLPGVYSVEVGQSSASLNLHASVTGPFR